MPQPWGGSHQRLTVGVASVTQIIAQSGALTIIRNDKAYVLSGLVFSGIVAADIAELKCDKCNELFATGQALGMHKSRCGQKNGVTTHRPNLSAK